MFKRGVIVLSLLPQIVAAEGMNGAKNFVILLVEVALVISVILIINRHILEKRRLATISRQINKVFLSLIVFFGVTIAAMNKCALHKEWIALWTVILLAFALFFYLPDTELMNQIFLFFIALALVFTVLHAVYLAQVNTTCTVVENVSFLVSPQLSVVALLLSIGFIINTILHIDSVRRWIQ